MSRQYGRNDVDYATFYTRWMKQLALSHTREELAAMYNAADRSSRKSAIAHLNAIRATSSMQSCSQRRAQSKNCIAADGERKRAIDAALEIYELFPEHTKEFSSTNQRKEPKCLE